MEARLQQETSKIEGSFAMDNLQAVAVELDRIWEMGIDYMPYRIFPSLATGDDLTLAAANFGVDRKQATYATVELTITGEAGTALDSEIVAVSGDVFFRLDEETQIPESGSISVTATATEPGLAGNVEANTVTEFLTNYAGLTSVNNPEAATGGLDEESDEDLRVRLDAKWKHPSTGGNASDYVRWALEQPGVARAKAFNPTAGLVEVVIVATGNEEADEELIEATETALEEVRPLGATVTVESGEAVPISVSAQVAIKEGYLLDDVEERITQALEDYLMEQSFQTSSISYMRIGNLLFVEGVADVLQYTLNNDTKSIALTERQFANLGEVTVSA